MQETGILARSNSYFLVIPLFLLFACTQLSEYDNEQIQRALGDSLLYSTESWDLDMNLFEEDQLIMNLKGNRSITFSNAEVNETRISGPVTIRIFNKDGSLKSEVTADSALYLPEDIVFEMFGNVKVETDDNKRLMSNYLKWERNDDKVSTTEFVTFISPPDSITAIGFFGNSDLTEYTLNQASGQVVID
jgi:LPS export ABC transporter protein LptC